VIEAARLKGGVFVSVLPIWEIAMLVKKGKLALPLSVRQWTEQALRLDGVRLLPLTPECLIRAVEYSAELNADPSDRILLASADAERLTFLTADKDILRFASKHRISCLKA
jgi:PIN domain nuclease of toxin-antitoxin system